MMLIIWMTIDNDADNLNDNWQGCRWYDMTIDNDRHFCCRCWRRVDAVGSKTLSIHSAPYNLRKFQTKLETTIIWENSDNNFRASSPVRGLQCGGEGLQFNNRPFLLNLDNEDIVLSMTTMMIIVLSTFHLKWSSWEGERYFGGIDIIGSGWKS